MCRVEVSTLVGITPGNQCLRGLVLDCFVSTKHSSFSESPCLLIFSVMIFSVQCLCWAHSILLSFLISESATLWFRVSNVFHLFLSSFKVCINKVLNVIASFLPLFLLKHVFIFHSNQKSKEKCMLDFSSHQKTEPKAKELTV